MASSSAERVRRLRQHRKGDHSLCLAENCEHAGTVTSAVTPPIETHVTAPDGKPRPPRLRERGRWLWQQLVENGDPSPAERVLIEEACRTADRLDRLDAISNGKDRAWLTLEVGDDGEITVVVDKVLTEARQQQLALKQILAELRQGGKAGGKSGGGQGGSIVDQLAARRQARLSGAAGS